MSDIEAPTAIYYVNANEKSKDGSPLSSGDWSQRTLQGPVDLVQRRLKQRHIQM